MKCRLERDGIQYEFDASSPGDVHDKLAAIESVVWESCGECGSDDISRDVFQTDAGKTMRKLKCRSCGASLDIFENKKTRFLFASRKSQDGELKGTSGKGWEIYQRNNNRASDAYSEPAANAPAAETTDQSSVPF